MATTIRARIYTRGEMSFAKLVCQTVGGQFFLFYQNYMDAKLICQTVGVALNIPINPELHSIRDVGYYAPRGPNLSKLCAMCLSFEFPISAKPQTSTSGTPQVAGLNHRHV
jgi:hypothetical protein